MNRKIALTFDNGPHEIGTPEVLDVLAARSIRATFFLVGKNLQSAHGKALAERIRFAGHRIGNHTITHGRPLGFRPGLNTVRGEIAAMQVLLGNLTQENLFRPNGDKGQLGPHLLSQEAVNYLIEEKYTVVTWNCLPEDWVPPAGSWVGRARRLLSQLAWSAIVLHDHRMAGESKILADFLDDLIQEGYEFTTEFPEDAILIDEGRPTAALSGNFTPAPA